jgi:hypothetical protein
MSSTSTTWTVDTNTKSGGAQTFSTSISSLKILGEEGDDAILKLFADEGDDNADHWRIVSSSSTNKLNFMSLASGTWSNVLDLYGSGTAASVYAALPAASKLYLDGAGGTTYLQESSDGHLEVNSGTTLDLTAPTVDINSTTELNIDTAIYDLNASGAVTLDGATMTIKGTGASKYGDDVATLDFDGSGAVSETGMTSCSITPSGAITLTAGAASTWSTSAGVLTLEGKTGISLEENGTAVITIDTDGKVGIGADATSPGYLLDVRDDTAGTTTMQIRNNENNSAANVRLRLSALNCNGDIFMNASAYSESNQYIPDGMLVEASTNASGGLGLSAAADAPIKFWTQNTLRMRIASSGEGTLSLASGKHVIAVDQIIRFADSSNDTVIVEVGNYKIPAKAIITRVAAVIVIDSNLSTHLVNIQMSATSGTNADTGISSGTELLGAGVTNTDSTDSTSASDIDMGAGTDEKDVWICNDVVRNGTSDQYIYVCNAGTGNGTTNSTAGTLSIIIEYYGID